MILLDSTLTSIAETMVKNKMEIGTLIRYKGQQLGWSIHTDVTGCVGVVLSEPNRHGQYKVQVMHKTLYLLEMHMEKL